MNINQSNTSQPNQTNQNTVSGTAQMTQSIIELKNTLETQSAELVAANQAHGEVFARHLSKWEAEKDAKQQSIISKEWQIQSNRVKLNGVAMAEFEMTKLHSENEQLRQAINHEKNLLARFLAEPTWQKAVGESVEARTAYMRAMAVRQTELQIAKLEVKALLTPTILEKINTLYGYFDIANNFPVNLRADLNKFVTLL